ncbi:putative transcriptional regulator, TetR family protein [Saccharothrix coeruleofusca]|uniref:Transcriptional regulator, TetR family protein n=1 Tax=Saccharothrix coeruleofusca TaxID=33919 RepID=A0A918EEE3_9PSEU|nr:putative transcriptional regulator, TetR family protein [Saccharothrix coeruleofusca]
MLEAVDDLLVDVGYAAMTMKGIAERAGVGRQTVYRWWATKAEILLEACAEDVREELVAPRVGEAREDLLGYLVVLDRFLVESPAGLAFRALLGEAQHDPAVRALVRDADLLALAARDVLVRVRPSAPAMPDLPLAAVQLIGPVVTQVLATGEGLPRDLLATHAATLLRAWQP